MRWVYRVLKGRKPTYESRVYRSVGELPDIRDDTWNHPFWINHVLNCVNQIVLDQSVDLNIHQAGLISAVYAPCLVRGKTDTVTVLDVGGGVGIYFPIVKLITSKIGIKLKYAVVDGTENCRNGTVFHGTQDEIKFFDSKERGIEAATQFLGRVDVCNICSTLHYILDWQAALKNISEIYPAVICISRAPTPDRADKEGYVIQHVTSPLGYCGRVKVVLIPRTKLISEMQRLGWELLSEAGYSGDGNWYWQEGVSDQIYFQQTIRQFLFVANRVN